MLNRTDTKSMGNSATNTGYNWDEHFRLRDELARHVDYSYFLSRVIKKQPINAWVKKRPDANTIHKYLRG